MSSASRWPKVDRFLISTLAAYALLAAVFHSRVKGWRTLVLEAAGAIALLLALQPLCRRIAARRPRCLLRFSSLVMVLIFVYEASIRLTFILSPGWRDDAVVKFETSLLGVQPAVWLQRFLSPGLTEWFMFSYLLYFLLYPVCVTAFCLKGGEALAEDLLWVVGVNNVLCNFGYLLFPVSDPVSRFGAGSFVPFKGFVFTPAGEFLRAHLMTTGGGMPSGHAAAVTIMALMAYRYHRRLSYVLIPAAVSIWIATVYCRFHYLSDTVMGILVAVLWWGALTAVYPRLRRARVRPADASP